MPSSIIVSRAPSYFQLPSAGRLFGEVIRSVPSASHAYSVPGTTPLDSRTCQTLLMNEAACAAEEAVTLSTGAVGADSPEQPAPRSTAAMTARRADSFTEEPCS